MPYVLIAAIPTCFFWGLDAYYLRQERLFRALYDRVRTAGGWLSPDAELTGNSPNQRDVEPFSMDTRQPPPPGPDGRGVRPVASWSVTWFAGTLAGFYAPLLLVVLVFTAAGYLKAKSDPEGTRLAALAKIGDSAAALSKSTAPDAVARALERLASAVERVGERPHAPPVSAPMPVENLPSSKPQPAKEQSVPVSSRKK